MKEVWVKADPWDKEMVTTALETGADAVVVPEGKSEEVKELGRIATVAEDGDLQWGRDVTDAEIRSHEDEERIVELSRSFSRVVVRTTDWTVIPLENLVARASNVMVEVHDVESAQMAAGVLEKGVHGIIVANPDSLKVREIVGGLKSGGAAVELAKLRVESLKPLGMGDRVCIDTCSLMGLGEGCLVGNSSRTLFLVHAESLENPYVSPRPFRVNAGPVHSYVMAPGGRTRYLSELKAGEEVLGVKADGESTPLLVGRVKIERRPLLMVQASGPEGQASIICQNAETIRLVDPKGEAVSVVKLQPGDEVLGYVETAGRHFGHKIEETITEA
jgi:3-dehydroquinate synthase II